MKKEDEILDGIADAFREIAETTGKSEYLESADDFSAKAEQRDTMANRLKAAACWISLRSSMRTIAKVFKNLPAIAPAKATVIMI